MRVSLLVVFLLPSAVFADLTFTVENPTDAPRPAACVTVPFAEVAKRVGVEKACPAAELWEVRDGAKPLPFQIDDTDDDGTADEIAFQVDLGPKEKKALTLAALSAPKLHGFPRRTRAVIRDNYEGPSWESESAGYRTYLDYRNPIDVFAKSEPMLSLDLFDTKGRSHHTIQPYGVDVLHVGMATGCGGWMLWRDGKLWKPYNLIEAAKAAMPGPKDQVRRYPAVLDGPVRAIARVTMGDWIVGKARITGVETWSIWAGKRWSTSTVTVPLKEEVVIATGVVKHPAAPPVKGEGYLYTWGRQTEPTEDAKKVSDLGMAVVFDPADAVKFVDDAVNAIPPEKESSSHIVLLKTDAAKTARWAFTSAWDQGSLGLKTKEAFEKEVKDTLQEWKSPVRVTFE